MAGTVVCKVMLSFSFIDHHGNHLILTYKGEKAGEKKDGHADHEGETGQHQHFPARFLWEKDVDDDEEDVDDGKKDVDDGKKKWNSFPNILTNEGERDKGHGNVHRSHSQSCRLALGRIWGNLENVSFNSKHDETQT